MRRSLWIFSVCVAVASAIALAPRVHAQEGAAHDATGATGTTAAGVAHETARAGEHPGGEGEHAAPLLPGNLQEAKEYFLAPAVWTLVIFVIMLAILYPTAWKQVLAGLKNREERIRKDIADAEAARGRAESTLREYNQQLATAEGRVRDMLAKATADAERLATSMKMQAQADSEEIKERATRDIEAARAQAVRDIQAQAADLGTLIASKILKRNLNPQDQQDLVSQSLDQLQTVR